MSHPWDGVIPRGGCNSAVARWRRNARETEIRSEAIGLQVFAWLDGIHTSARWTWHFDCVSGGVLIGRRRSCGRPAPMQTLIQDLRYGVRMLLKNPGFTTIAVLTLGLGIGLNTSMFTLMNELLLRPLPFPDSSRLLRVYRTTHQVQRGGVSPADFLELKNNESGIGRFSAYSFSSVSLSEGARPAEWRNTI